jgi:hypothetical protein
MHVGRSSNKKVMLGVVVVIGLKNDLSAGGLKIALKVTSRECGKERVR